jgi:hypothetical protein
MMHMDQYRPYNREYILIILDALPHMCTGLAFFARAQQFYLYADVVHMHVIRMRMCHMISAGGALSADLVCASLSTVLVEIGRSPRGYPVRLAEIGRKQQHQFAM